MTKFFFLTIASATMLLSVGGVAAAQTTESPPTATVRYDDLNLTDSAGVGALQSRVHAAAQSVCQTDLNVRDLTRYALYRSCLRNAELVARPQQDHAIAEARALLLARDTLRQH